MTRRATLWTMALLLAGAGLSMTPQPASGLEIGQKFPLFRFSEVDGGDTVSTRILYGRKSIIAIFASW